MRASAAGVAALLSTVVCGLGLANEAQAQVFAPGARTEFVGGFGFRTFASFQRFDASGLPGAVHARVVPVVVVRGVGRGLSLVGVVPFVDVESRASGRSLGAGAGIGDATVRLKWRFLRRHRGAGTLQASLEGGVKMPTGANRLRDRAGALLPRGLQRGSGSWDPTADLIVTWVPAAARGRWVLGADLGFVAPTRHDDFEAGTRVSYNAYAKYKLLPRAYPGRDLFVTLELNGARIARARLGSDVLGATGGDVLFVSPGVQFLARQNLVLEAGVQLPVRTALNGVQREPGTRALFGLRYIVL